MAIFAAQRTPAQVAELVDALGSGPSGGNIVEVRVLSWAPVKKIQVSYWMMFAMKPAPAGFLRLGQLKRGRVSREADIE